MKFEVKIQDGSKVKDHTLEMRSQGNDATSGRVEFVMDGVTEEMDWAEDEPGVYSLIENGKSWLVSLLKEDASSSPSSNAGRYEAVVGGRRVRVELRDSRVRRRSASSLARQGPLEILAPMPGRVVRVLAGEGARVGQGEGLVVIEAMKMQNEIRAPRDGQAMKVHVREGEGVEAGARLVSLE
jgi:biotin carboxyl carrier protein